MIAVLGQAPSFGFGDRLGIATAGHCKALVEFGGSIRGVFAQQSIREMARTGRNPGQVFQDAENALADAGYNAVRGADGDHLKNREDVDAVFQVGFSFYTIDPSEHVDNQADEYSPEEVLVHFQALQNQPSWVGKYLRQEIRLDLNEKLCFDEIGLKRCALKYGAAIDHSVELGRYIVSLAQRGSREIEIELSIDETEQPTTPLEHYVFARELAEAGLPLVSVAPRFFGNFEKGIDFFGDRQKFETTLKWHASVARNLGGYKLSLHSGSDKLSIYEAFARHTRGKFHVKTAGTSYLEALRVTGSTDEPLFRDLVEFSRSRFEKDRATYHLSTQLDDAVLPADIHDGGELLQEYLGTNAGRQILHVTFGSVVNSPELGPLFRENLHENQSTYTEFLVEHFRKHLEPLTGGLPGLS